MNRDREGAAMHGAGHKSGFVSIIGRPNTGKSTLLNALVGQKVAIVADKPQTTRTAIQGVLTTPDAQIIFIDTPGIHKSDSSINKRMMDAVRASLEERDAFIYMVDATKPFGSADEKALSILHGGQPVIIALNKIDALPAKHEMLPLLEEYRKRYDFEAYLPISAATGEGLDDLRAEVLKLMPEGPEYFPPDHFTDQPARFLASELIREKILAATHQEVPHSVTVLVDKWEEISNLIRIYATIVVERDGQKGIVIGSKGAMLREIGTLARQEMEALFGSKVYLDLHVKVESGWREKAAFLNTVDWRTMSQRDD
ncbi:MAG TPA: GTPase Era [Bryobacteraceae bacterium]|jgi:GTP-binding protein Era|nr:GTPase Era [Bryobacteraceae bacterium]